MTEVEVTWSVTVTVEEEDIDEYGDLGVAACAQARGMMEEAVNRGEGATLMAVRYPDTDTLIGRYDIEQETPRLFSLPVSQQGPA